MKTASAIKKVIPVFALVFGIWILFFSINVKASGYSGISEGTSVHMYTGTYEVSRDSNGEYKKVVYADTGGSKVVKSSDGSDLGNWDKEFVYTDQVGSTSFNLDTNGNVTPEFKDNNDNLNKLRYFAYGRTINTIDTTNLPTEDTYTGQKKDTEIDLMYYNARYYDPVRGRFIQADSVNDGLNRYMYVSGNPVNANDPTGNCSLACLFGKVKDFIAGGPNDNISMQAGFDAQVDYMLSPEYVRDQAIAGTVTTAGMSLYAVPALAPVAMTYMIQFQQAMGHPKVAGLGTGVRVANGAAGIGCTATNDPIVCGASGVLDALDTTMDIGNVVAIDILAGSDTALKRLGRNQDLNEVDEFIRVGRYDVAEEAMMAYADQAGVRVVDVVPAVGEVFDDGMFGGHYSYGPEQGYVVEIFLTGDPALNAVAFRHELGHIDDHRTGQMGKIRETRSPLSEARQSLITAEHLMNIGYDSRAAAAIEYARRYASLIE